MMEFSALYIKGCCLDTYELWSNRVGVLCVFLAVRVTVCLSCCLCSVIEVCISKSLLLLSPALYATRHCLLLTLLQSPHADAAVVGEPRGGRWASPCSVEGLCCAVLLKAQDQRRYWHWAGCGSQSRPSGTRKGKK